MSDNSNILGPEDLGMKIFIKFEISKEESDSPPKTSQYYACCYYYYY